MALAYTAAGLIGYGIQPPVRAAAEGDPPSSQAVPVYTQIPVDLPSYIQPNPLVTNGPQLDGEPTIRLDAGEAGAEWAVQVDEAGSYYVSLLYMPADLESESDLELLVTVNGEQEEKAVLKRAWADTEEIQSDNNGNHVRPRSEQTEAWITALAGRFDFTQGENRLKLAAEEESGLYIAGIALYSSKSAGTYEEYTAGYAGRITAPKAISSFWRRNLPS